MYTGSFWQSSYYYRFILFSYYTKELPSFYWNVKVLCPFNFDTWICGYLGLSQKHESFARHWTTYWIIALDEYFIHLRTLNQGEEWAVMILNSQKRWSSCRKMISCSFSMFHNPLCIRPNTEYLRKMRVRSRTSLKQHRSTSQISTPI